MSVLKYSLGKSLRVILLLCLMLQVAFVSAATIGEPFPNFTLPSAYVGYAQQLKEQHGKPVMLVVLDRCDRCEKKLLRFQHLNISYAIDGLETWVIWQSHKKDQPPHISLPVLQADSRLQSGWQTPEKRPAIYLINRDGVLEHTLYGSLKSLQRQLEPLLAQWLQQETTRPEGQ